MAYDGINIPGGIGEPLESMPTIEKAFALLIKARLSDLADIDVKAICEISMYPGHVLADIEVTGLREIIDEYGLPTVKSTFEGTAIVLKSVEFTNEGNMAFLEFEYAGSANEKQPGKPDQAPSTDVMAEISVGAFKAMVIVDLKDVFAAYGALSNVQIVQEGKKYLVSCVVNEPGGVPDIEQIKQEAGVDLALNMIDCQVPLDLVKGDILYYEFMPVEDVQIPAIEQEIIQKCVDEIPYLKFLGFHPANMDDTYIFEVSFDGGGIQLADDIIPQGTAILTKLIEKHGGFISFQSIDNSAGNLIATIVPLIHEIKGPTGKKLTVPWKSSGEEIAKAITNQKALDKLLFADNNDEIPVDILPDGTVVPSKGPGAEKLDKWPAVEKSLKKQWTASEEILPAETDESVFDMIPELKALSEKEKAYVHAEIDQMKIPEGAEAPICNHCEVQMSGLLKYAIEKTPGLKYMGYNNPEATKDIFYVQVKRSKSFSGEIIQEILAEHGLAVQYHGIQPSKDNGGPNLMIVVMPSPSQKCQKCNGNGQTGSGFFQSKCEPCFGTGILNEENKKKAAALKAAVQAAFEGKLAETMTLPEIALKVGYPKTFSEKVSSAMNQLKNIKCAAELGPFDTEGSVEVVVYVDGLKDALEIMDVFYKAGVYPIHQSADVVEAGDGQNIVKHKWILKAKKSKIEKSEGPAILINKAMLSGEVYNNMVKKVVEAGHVPSGPKEKFASVAAQFGAEIFDYDEEGRYTIQLAGKAYFNVQGFMDALKALGLKSEYMGSGMGPGDTQLYKYWITSQQMKFFREAVESYKDEPMFEAAFAKMTVTQYDGFMKLIKGYLNTSCNLYGATIKVDMIRRVNDLYHIIHFYDTEPGKSVHKSYEIKDDLFVNLMDQALGKVPSEWTPNVPAEKIVVSIDVGSPDGDKTVMKVMKGDEVVSIEETDAPGAMLCTGFVQSALVPSYIPAAISSGEIKSGIIGGQKDEGFGYKVTEDGMEFTVLIGGNQVKFTHKAGSPNDAIMEVYGQKYVIANMHIQEEKPIIQLFNLEGKKPLKYPGKKTSKISIEAIGVGEVGPNKEGPEVYQQGGVKKLKAPEPKALLENQKQFYATSQIDMGAAVYLSGQGKVSAIKNSTQVKPIGIAMHSAMNGTQVVVAIGGALLKGAVQMGKEELAGPQPVPAHMATITLISTDLMTEQQWDSMEQKVYTLAGVGTVVFTRAPGTKNICHISFVQNSKVLVEYTGTFGPNLGIIIDREVTIQGEWVYKMYQAPQFADRKYLTMTPAGNFTSATQDIPQAHPVKFHLLQKVDSLAFMADNKEIMEINALGQVTISGEMFQKKDSMMESMQTIATQFWEVISSLNPLKGQLFKAAALTAVLKDGAAKLEAENLALKAEFKKLHFEYVGKYEERALKPHRQGRFENVADNIVNEEPAPE